MRNAATGFSWCVWARSDGADLLGLRALLALRHVELDALVLIQRPVTIGGDGRVVHENVGGAVVRRDEAEALLGVEPLHCALNHETRLPQKRDGGPTVRVTDVQLGPLPAASPCLGPGDVVRTGLRCSRRRTTGY